MRCQRRRKSRARALASPSLSQVPTEERQVLALVLAVLGTPAPAWLRRRGRNGFVDLLEEAVPMAGLVADLPCPWCLAPTAESDARCPGCGHRFG
jgi:hypothetical protein